MADAHDPTENADGRGCPSPERRRARRRAAFAAWVGLCLLGAGWLAATRPWVRLNMRFINSQAVQELGGLGYVGFDCWDMVRSHWAARRLGGLDATPYRQYLATLAARRRPPPAVPPARKHVVYVQMEAVDGLVIGARHEGRPLMPFLEKLAHEQVYFANVIDNTASGRTTDAEFLVLTSQVPLRRAPAYVSQSLDRVPSLPKVLKAAGYHCWSMHGYDGSFWRREAAHRALGYDESFFRDDLDASELIGWGISDRSVLHQAAQRLAVAQQPTFAHVILLTNHHPCSYVREQRGGAPAGHVADYVESVAYVDASIAAFFAELEAAGVLDNCIVALFGDHDSGLGNELERGLAVAPGRAMADTVPLLVTGLSEAPRRIDEIAGLQDLPVVVLEALGLPVPPQFTGNSLDRPGRTVGAMYGALEFKGQRLLRPPLPVDQETLTLLALRYPERLSSP